MCSKFILKNRSIYSWVRDFFRDFGFLLHVTKKTKKKSPDKFSEGGAVEHC
jgi:hypothetical protein